MYPDWAPAVAGFLVLWLGILSFFIWRQRNFLNELFPRSGERDIRKKFEEILRIAEGSEESVKKLEGKLADLDNRTLRHIQRVELLRYNPYDDTGGNISFSLALLDGQGNGYILTSLHARAGTRVFAKQVAGGKGQKYELSKEEQETVERALKKT